MSTAAFAQRRGIAHRPVIVGKTHPTGVETSISRQFHRGIEWAYNAWKFGYDMKLNLYFVQPELGLAAGFCFIATLRSAKTRTVETRNIK